MLKLSFALIFSIYENGKKRINKIFSGLLYINFKFIYKIFINSRI